MTASVEGTLIDNEDLFTFEDEDRVYCAPSASGSPITITITFPEQIVLLEIDIHGNDRFLISNEYVTSFSVSYTRNDGTFVSYTRDTGSVVCINIIEVYNVVNLSANFTQGFSVPDVDQHFFGLWPPINSSSIQVIIHDWENQSPHVLIASSQPQKS